jgi:hypothetical protein
MALLQNCQCQTTTVGIDEKTSKPFRLYQCRKLHLDPVTISKSELPWLNITDNYKTSEMLGEAEVKFQTFSTSAPRRSKGEDKIPAPTGANRRNSHLLPDTTTHSEGHPGSRGCVPNSPLK